MTNKDIECCANCKHLLDYPKNNSYNDVEHLCTKIGYFVMGIEKDRNKVERYSPGGKKLNCEYARR